MHRALTNTGVPIAAQALTAGGRTTSSPSASPPLQAAVLDHHRRRLAATTTRVSHLWCGRHCTIGGTSESATSLLRALLKVLVIACAVGVMRSPAAYALALDLSCHRNLKLVSNTCISHHRSMQAHPRRSRRVCTEVGQGEAAGHVRHPEMMRIINACGQDAVFTCAATTVVLVN